MHFNPLIPYIPAFATFFIYGYLTGFFFLAWKRAHWGIILGYLFWIAYLAWCLFVFPLTEVQESYLQKWFYAGLIFAFIRSILTSSFAEQLKEDMSHFVYMVRRTWNVLAGLLPNKQSSSNQQTHQSQQSQQTNHNQYNDTTEQTRRAEQARREAEARARRTEKEKQNQQSRADDPKPEPPTAEKRTPEEILGLKSGWTQEDLIKTYKSEAQRTHPDKWIGKPASVRHAMEEEFKNIQQAYNQLKT
jgi:DnaJ domain